MQAADLLVVNAAEVATCAGPQGARRGAAMGDAGVLREAAVAIKGGRIVAVGPQREITRQFRAEDEIDARGKVVCPGFVDPHTHVVYAGQRIDEFELRIRGASYQDIAAAGGGILSTVRATREASLADIVAQSRKRLAQMRRLGTTTAEVKTGYGLDAPSELKLLQAIEALDGTPELVPTFMAAHAVPPEFRGRADQYVDLVIREMLPSALAWYRASCFAARGTPMFVDVFCEANAFDLAQSQRVLEAARALGLPLKAHVDEFSALGGLSMALALGAMSVDHLDVTDEEDIELLGASSAIAIVIPTVTFNLGGHDYANARAMIDAGAAVALTTDINPGSSPCPSMPLAMAIACRYQRLLPAEALVAATLNAAHAVGLGERIGSIEPGKQADILIIDADDHRALACEFGGNPVEAVIQRGTLLKP